MTPDVALDVMRPGELSLAPEGSIQLTATVEDQNGQVMPGAAFAWASTDTAVVTVDSVGLVEAVNLGSAEVTATSGSAGGRLRIAVMHPASVEPRSTGGPFPFVLTSLGETMQLTAIARDGNGNEVAGAGFSWESEDSAVVTVDSTGLVTAVSNSRYDPTGGSPSQGPVPTGVVATSGPVAHKWPIVVRQAVASVVVTAPDTIWGSYVVVALAVEPFDANGHTVFRESTNYDRAPYYVHAEPIGFVWESDNPAVVRVERYVSRDNYYHNAVGISEGTATITATASSDPGPRLSGSAEITVAVTPRPGYPIHVHYVEDPPENLRRAMESAAATWGRILAPTEAAPFVFDRGWRPEGKWSGIGPFRAGDTLPAGLHIYVLVDPSATGLAQTTVSPAFPAVGRIAWLPDYLNAGAQYYPLVYRIALHEIGHVLGIGWGARWQEWLRIPDPAKPENAYLTDPEAIAAFDRMGGTDFPVTTPKIPLRDNTFHWDPCTGIPDIMSGDNQPLQNFTVTELTMASLAEGYVYDPATVPGLKLDPEVWNRATRGCRDGQYDPPDAGGTAAQAPGSPWAVSLQGDVIEIPGNR